MRKKIWFASVCFGLCTSLGIAQTTVTTTGGTQNKVPKFSGSSAISDSAITEVNGNVGIGTITPAYPLDVNGGIDAATVIGTAMFTGHQVGGTYVYSDAIFKAVTDNTNGSENYYFQGLTGSTTNFSVRADGQAYFAGGINSGNLGFVSSYRNPSTNYTNLFLGGAIVDNGNGSYTVQTDGGSNYFAAIRMDNGGNAGAINFYTAGSTGGSSYTVSNSQLPSYQRMTIVGSNVGIGTTAPSAKLEVNGSIKLSGTGSSITFPNGDIQSVAWNGTLCGGDYAESVDVSGDRTHYEPGDVLVIDPAQPGKFLKSNKPYSRLIAGIYSTKPGVLGRRQTSDPKTATTEVPMAMVGIVPTKVTAENGPIEVGDLLVTSSQEGYAMKGTDERLATGSVLGKTLGSLASGSGVIEVLVSLQ